MGALVVVPVLYDQSGQFLGPSGRQMGISALAAANGIVQKPGDYAVPPNVAPLVDTLEIKDPNLGTLYVLLTVAQFQERVSVAMQGGGGGGTNLYFEAVGDVTFVVPADTWLMSFAANPEVGPETLSVGTVPLGSNVVVPSPYALDSWQKNSKLVNQFYSKTDATTIYISGGRDNVRYEILMF